MSWLLRVALPDVPGSLGRLATAIGSVGGNIDAIEIVEHGIDGRALDDVFLDLEPGVMPDGVVSACHQLDGVEVQWISRYTAGSNLLLDLEVVEAMTEDPARAVDVLVESLPAAFRFDWAVQVRTGDDGRRGLVRRTPAAPEALPDGVTGWPEHLRGAAHLTLDPPPWGDVVLGGSELGPDLVLVARRGGPPILDSELARLRHLCALARSISRSGKTG